MTRLETVFSFIFTITILSQFSFLTAENAVPVAIWGDSAGTETAVNPFVMTTREEFDEILKHVLKEQPPVLAILKDDFCNEDILRHRKQFKEVISGTQYKYIPAVDQPITALKELASYNQSYDADVESISNGQLLIKPISNLDSLSELVTEIKNDSPGIVVVLTGKSCAYRSERIKRDTPAATDSKEFIVGTDRVLFYSSKPLSLKTSKDEAPTELSQPVVSNDRGDGTKTSPLILRMQFDGPKSKIDLEFNFEVKSVGYYNLGTVKYQTGVEPYDLKAKSEIVFPFNFSYKCSQKSLFTNGDISLNISDLQVEINGKRDRFSDAYNCVGFTTIPIWTGIFVTTILGIIMMWGLSMIIDIRTMDRFDDPKGKTITISAQE